MEPIEASEIETLKKESIPDEVISVFNDLIVKYWDNKQATFTKETALDLMAEALKCKVSELEESWGEAIVDIYRKVGWNVRIGENNTTDGYEKYYVFTKTKKKKKKERSMPFPRGD